MQLTIITFCSFLVSFSLLLPPRALIGAKTNLSSGSLQQAPQNVSESSQAASDRGWPRGYSLPSEAQMVVFQPQIASWDGQKHAIGFAAVSYVAKGEQKPALGTIKLETNTDVSVEKRLVKFSTLKITETNFPTLSKDQTQEVITELEKNIPDEDRLIALDRVLAYVDKSTINPKNVDGLKSDPPTIFIANTSSILVSFDGDPIWSPIKDNELKFAVNTNWDVFKHEPTGMFYLRNDATWLKSTSAKGPWSSAGRLPDSFTKLPDDDNWKDVRASLPGKPAGQVHVYSPPAFRLIKYTEPKYVPVPNTGLLWSATLIAICFGSAKMVCVLPGFGRWFKAPNLNEIGFRDPDLPEDFKLISVEHHARARSCFSTPVHNKRQKLFSKCTICASNSESNSRCRLSGRTAV